MTKFDKSARLASSHNVLSEVTFAEFIPERAARGKDIRANGNERLGKDKFAFYACKR